MVKKRRLPPGNKNRPTDRSPHSGDEVISARDRFKGALQDLLPHSEEDSESSDEEQWSKSKRLATHKKKQPNEKPLDIDQNKSQQAYVMKLFDRSVDLAQFNENTPLYPICRAWIANQPHQVYNNIKKSSSPEPKDGKDTNKIVDESDIEAGKDAYSLPQPTPVPNNEQIRIPKPIPCQSKYNTFYSESREPPSREEILMDNLKHWGNVRKSWLEASAKNEMRYKNSFKVLVAIFNKAQGNFTD